MGVKEGVWLFLQSQETQESENLAMSEKKAVESKEWALEPETEYRFELDPGTSLAIKVCPPIFIVRSGSFLESSCCVFSSQRVAPKFSDLNW